VSERFLAGLDVGGGGVRCALVAADGGRVVFARRPWRAQAPPGSPMASEFDPDEVWNAVAEAVREACREAGASAAQVAGIAATSLRHGSVVLDADGRELLATTNRDARGTGPILALAPETQGLLQRRTGHWPNPVMPAGRLLALAAEDPERYARAATHLAVSDWLAFRLCGERATDPSHAAETLLFDLRTRDWAPELAERLGLRADLLPPVRDAGTRLGALRAEAAEALGLAPGTPVAVGGADTPCALLGAGVTAPGGLGAVLGSTAPLQQVLGAPCEGEVAHLWQSPHALHDRWVLESNAGGVGEAAEWMGTALFAGRDHPVLHLLDAARRSAPGAAGLASTFGGQVMDARALGLPLGSVALSPMTAADDPDRVRHLARAVIEGLAFTLRANLEQLSAAAGPAHEDLLALGGLARSPVFTALLADVCGTPVEVPEHAEGSAVGAAICAGVGAGVFASLEEGADAVVRVGRRHEPSADAAAYAGLYSAWREERASRCAVDERRVGAVLQHLLAAPAGSAGTAPLPRPRVLVAADFDDASLAALRELADVEYAPFRQAMRMLTGPALVEALRGVDVFVTEIDVVDADALAACADLRALIVCRGDAVNVDLTACTALGIPVMNTPGRNADAVADLTLAFLLMLARKLAPANAFLREPGGEAGDMGRMGKAFGTFRGRELWGKTVGLVGLGAVGRRVVSRVRACGARCVVADPYVDPDAVRLAGAEPVTLAALLERADFVSLHAAVSDETRGLVGEAELARMKPGSALVNTARAALVDEEALRAALESGHLAGAALDVFAEEPPASDHPLLALPQVVATPHVGGNTEDVAAHQGRLATAELARLLRGERPQHVLNPETLAAFSWIRPRPAPAPDWREALAESAGPAVTDLQRGAPKRPAAATPSAASPAATEAAPAAAGGPDAARIRERFEAVLRAFVAAIPADAALARFAADAGDVTLHFSLPDVGSEFHLGFADGRVFAGLGRPEAAASVQLKLPADLLDGMFTGRRNPMQAAMDGELSFNGDAAKAMTLNSLQADLSRVYGAARGETGDPGDLASLGGGAPAAANAPAPAAAAPAAPARAGDERDALVAVVHELYETQLITSTGGNVSVRTAAGDTAWITPSQLFKGDLGPDVLVRIDLDGRGVDDGARSPSSEALMHTAVLRARPEVQAVIHCHAPNATILANAGLPFLPISTEAAFLRGIGRVPFIMPGTRELADAVVEALGDGWAVLMANHGLLVAGRSLRRAADMTEIVERTCQVILGCRAVGADPPVLPDDVVEQLAALGDLMA